MRTPSCCWPSWLSTVFGAKGRSAAALLPTPSPALRPLMIEPSACSIDLDPTTRALSECGGFGRLVSTARNYSLSDAPESLDDGNDLALLAGAGANAVDSAGRAPQESAAAGGDGGGGGAVGDGGGAADDGGGDGGGGGGAAGDGGTAVVQVEAEGSCPRGFR